MPREQPSRCLLHADWMMLNNALLQMLHVGEEIGAYSYTHIQRQPFSLSGVRFKSRGDSNFWVKIGFALERSKMSFPLMSSSYNV